MEIVIGLVVGVVILLALCEFIKDLGRLEP